MVKSNKNKLRNFNGARIDWVEKHLNNEIDRWHKDMPEAPLHEYLGMTKEQYNEFVKDPKAFIQSLINAKETPS